MREWRISEEVKEEIKRKEEKRWMRNRRIVGKINGKNKDRKSEERMMEARVEES